MALNPCNMFRHRLLQDLPISIQTIENFLAPSLTLDYNSPKTMPSTF